MNDLSAPSRSDSPRRQDEGIHGKVGRIQTAGEWFRGVCACERIFLNADYLTIAKSCYVRISLEMENTDVLLALTRSKKKRDL